MPTTSFMRYPKDRLAALASASALRAIREGLLWTMPCLLVSALFLVLSVVAGQLGLSSTVVQELAAVHTRLNSVMPMLVSTSVGYMLSIRHRVPNLPAAFLCLSYVVIAEGLLAPYPHAVSYTHLDVYKRQGPDRTTAARRTRRRSGPACRPAGRRESHRACRSPR